MATELPMVEERVHAILNPSGEDQWMTCLGSTFLTKDEPEQTSEYAEEGTDYHELAAVCLDEDTNAADYIGHEMKSGNRVVTEENAEFLQKGYIDHIRGYAAHGTLLVEERCPIDHLTGEPNAKGTADAAVIPLEGTELMVGDLKFGRGVEVSPVRNRQAMTYALGVIRKNRLEDLIETVKIVIFQPRIGDGKPKEWVVSMAELLAFGEEVKAIARRILTVSPQGELLWTAGLPLTPSEKACRFCKVKATCPALKGFVDGRMAEGFENLTTATHSEIGGATLSRAEILGRAMDGIDLIEIYMKGVQSQVEIELLAGKPVLGKDGAYKLVQGKKGARQWDDEAEVEKLFKVFRLKDTEMYKMDLISPAVAEKLFKKKDNPRKWAKAVKHIKQSEGGKHVANALDDRPAIQMEKPEEGFVNETNDASEFI